MTPTSFQNSQPASVMLSAHSAAAKMVEATTSASEVKDLKGEQGLEAEHGPVAAPVHPARKQQQRERKQQRSGQRSAVTAEVVHAHGSHDHAEREHHADGDGDDQRGRTLVLLERPRRLPLRLRARHTRLPARPRQLIHLASAVSSWSRSSRAAPSGSAAPAIALSTTARRAPAAIT